MGLENVERRSAPMAALARSADWRGSTLRLPGNYSWLSSAVDGKEPDTFMLTDF